VSAMRPLADVLAGLGAPRLVIVGDLLLDRYLTGFVDRISPEAPIQVLRVETEVERMGGAGSVAIDVSVLGADTTLIGVVGDDEDAARLAAMAASAGIRLEAHADPSRRTSVKTRHVARSHTSAQQVLRVDQETVKPLEGPAAAAVRSRLEAALADADALLVSDYGKGVCTPELLQWLTQAGRERGIPVVVDPKGADFTRYRGATCLTPNRPETRLATGIPVDEGDLAAAERAAARLVEELGLEFVLVTLDREGMYLKIGDAPGSHIPTTPREVFDVTGAGDMVLSALAVALASGATPEEAAGLANVAAGLEVEHFGVVSVTREEILSRLASGGEPTTTKRVDRTRLGPVLDRLRAEGRRIVFTNGCFDILHAGHVRYLQAARREGDVLIVGLNSDASVRSIKGPARPIHDERDRIEVLSGLACVDHVVVFDEDTPLTLIEALRPDVLVKGEDWRDKGVVGREVVEARGGKVVLLPLLAGRSTTNVVERLQGER